MRSEEQHQQNGGTAKLPNWSKTGVTSLHWTRAVKSLRRLEISCMI